MLVDHIRFWLRSYCRKSGIIMSKERELEMRTDGADGGEAESFSSKVC